MSSAVDATCSPQPRLHVVDDAMQVQIEQAAFRARPQLHRHTTSLVTSLVTSLSLVTGLLG